MLTFPMSKNAKQDVVSPFFEFKIDDIYKMAQENRNAKNEDQRFHITCSKTVK